MPRVGAVEGFVAERKVGDDVALDGRLQHAATGTRTDRANGSARRAPRASSRTAARMSPRKPSTSAMPSPPARRHGRAQRRIRRQAIEDLLNQRDALLDFANADPNSRVDVAVVPDGNLEAEFVIGRIGEIAPRVEVPARGAPDIAAAAILAGQRRTQGARRRRSGPEAKRCCRKAQPAAGNERRASSSNSRIRAAPLVERSTPTPPGTMQSIISR